MCNLLFFVKIKRNDFLLVQIYIDDILFGVIDESLCKKFSKMHKEFEMSMMGELNFFLELQMKQCQYNIFINQEKYVKELLKKYMHDSSKHDKILMASNHEFDLDSSGKLVLEKVYRCMSGSLLFLTISRPGIMFNVCLYARFQLAPRESHLRAVKKK